MNDRNFNFNFTAQQTVTRTLAEINQGFAQMAEGEGGAYGTIRDVLRQIGVNTTQLDSGLSAVARKMEALDKLTQRYEARQDTISSKIDQIGGKLTAPSLDADSAARFETQIAALEAQGTRLEQSYNQATAALLRDFERIDPALAELIRDGGTLDEVFGRTVMSLRALGDTAQQQSIASRVLGQSASGLVTEYGSLYNSVQRVAEAMARQEAAAAQAATANVAQQRSLREVVEAFNNATVAERDALETLIFYDRELRQQAALDPQIATFLNQLSQEYREMALAAQAARREIDALGGAQAQTARQGAAAGAAGAGAGAAGGGAGAARTVGNASRTRTAVAYSLQNLGGPIGQVASAAAFGGPEAAAAAAVIAGIAGVAKGTQEVIQYTQQAASTVEQERIAFTLLFGTVAEGNKQLQFTRDLAAKGLNMDELVLAERRFAALNVAAGESHEILLAIGDATAATGNQAGQIDKLSKALADVATKGHLQAEELRQFSNAGIPLVAALAENLHKSQGEVTQLIHDGKISAQQAFDAFEAFTQKQYGGALDAQAHTMRGLLGQLDNLKEVLGAAFGTPAMSVFEELLGRITNKLKDPAVVAQLEQWGMTFGEVVRWIINTNIGLANIIVQIRNFFGDHLSLIEELKAVDQTMADYWQRIEDSAKGTHEQVESVADGTAAAAASAAELNRLLGEVNDSWQEARTSVNASADLSERMTDFWDRVQQSVGVSKEQAQQMAGATGEAVSNSEWLGRMMEIVRDNAKDVNYEFDEQLRSLRTANTEIDRQIADRRRQADGEVARVRDSNDDIGRSAELAKRHYDDQNTALERQITLLDRVYGYTNDETAKQRLERQIAVDKVRARDVYTSAGQQARDRLVTEEQQLADLTAKMQHDRDKDSLEDQKTANSAAANVDQRKFDDQKYLNDERLKQIERERDAAIDSYEDQKTANDRLIAGIEENKIRFDHVLDDLETHFHDLSFAEQHAADVATESMAAAAESMATNSEAIALDVYNNIVKSLADAERQARTTNDELRKSLDLRDRLSAEGPEYGTLPGANGLPGQQTVPGAGTADANKPKVGDRNAAGNRMIVGFDAGGQPIWQDVKPALPGSGNPGTPPMGQPSAPEGGSAPQQNTSGGRRSSEVTGKFTVQGPDGKSHVVLQPVYEGDLTEDGQMVIHLDYSKTPPKIWLTASEYDTSQPQGFRNTAQGTAYWDNSTGPGSSNVRAMFPSTPAAWRGNTGDLGGEGVLPDQFEATLTIRLEDSQGNVLQQDRQFQTTFKRNRRFVAQQMGGATMSSG